MDPLDLSFLNFESNIRFVSNSVLQYKYLNLEHPSHSNIRDEILCNPSAARQEVLVHAWVVTTNNICIVLRGFHSQLRGGREMV